MNIMNCHQLQSCTVVDHSPPWVLSQILKIIPYVAIFPNPRWRLSIFLLPTIQNPHIHWILGWKRKEKQQISTLKALQASSFWLSLVLNNDKHFITSQELLINFLRTDWVIVWGPPFYTNSSCAWFIPADWPLQQRKLCLKWNFWESWNLWQTQRLREWWAGDCERAIQSEGNWNCFSTRRKLKRCITKLVYTSFFFPHGFPFLFFLMWLSAWITVFPNFLAAPIQCDIIEAAN